MKKKGLKKPLEFSKVVAEERKEETRERRGRRRGNGCVW